MSIETVWVIPKNRRRYYAYSVTEVPGVGRCLYRSKFGVEGRENEDAPTVRAKDGFDQDLLEFLQDQYPQKDNDHIEAGMKAGYYHPLIWRPNMPAFPRDRFTRDASAAANLYAKLERILLTVEPADEQAAVFGHDIRELLVLACMEVESAFKSVLQANAYPGERWNTNDYVKLRDPMRLTEYKVNLVPHWGWTPFAPFAGWRAAKPSETLGWYEAYNLAKHDRDAHFNKATLGHAIHALGAVYVLMVARYGFKLYGDVRSKINPTTFGPAEKPDFLTRSQQYVPTLDKLPPVEVPISL